MQFVFGIILSIEMVIFHFGPSNCIKFETVTTVTSYLTAFLGIFCKLVDLPFDSFYGRFKES